MPTWSELESRFREIEPQLRHASANHQWGYGGESWYLAGIVGTNVGKRFKALAQIAGEKLKADIERAEKNESDLVEIADAVDRWYKAIWRLSNNFEFGTYGDQLDAQGNVLGRTYVGSIPQIAEASSVFCLELAARFTEEAKLEPDGPSRTRVDQMLDHLRDHPLIAAIIVIGIVFISIASFTDAVERLISLLHVFE